ncbi:tigger transposable element-derived protein 1 [Pteropus medius]|uniref:CENPB DNA-binding domain-containing protein 1 n=1 Tax=Pteropus vampyrus TaxID=132908 RepID=UPI00196AD64E|nr:CENPB DNA-binding domain-containing protein 1 [Pteropus giganteus]
MPAKRPLNATVISSAKRERKAITLDIKLEVLRRFEVGEKLSQIAKALGLAVSTVATIRDNKEKIKASSQIATPLRASRLTRHRSAVMETMERLLHVWLEDQSQRNMPLSVTIIQEKAKSLFDDLQREQGESSQKEKFSASKGWFVRFKERHCLPHFKIDSIAPGNKDTYPEVLKSIIEEDSAPCHPANLSDLSDNVRVEYLHDSTADSVQPMGQGVTSTFKAHYLRRTFEHILEATDGEDTAVIREFWRNYNIMDAMDNIAVAWEALRPATMNSVWEKIWPQCVQSQSVSQTDNIARLRRNIVTLARTVAFEEIVEADVDQLLRSHEEALSNEGLMQLDREPAGQEGNEDAAPALRQLTTRQLAAAFSHFEAGLQVLTSCSHDDEWKLKVSRAINDAVTCYRELYSEKKRCSKQPS